MSDTNTPLAASGADDPSAPDSSIDDDKAWDAVLSKPENVSALAELTQLLNFAAKAGLLGKPTLMSSAPEGDPHGQAETQKQNCESER